SDESLELRLDFVGREFDTSLSQLGGDQFLDARGLGGIRLDLLRAMQPLQSGAGGGGGGQCLDCNDLSGVQMEAVLGGVAGDDPGDSGEEWRAESHDPVERHVFPSRVRGGGSAGAAIRFAVLLQEAGESCDGQPDYARVGQTPAIQQGDRRRVEAPEGGEDFLGVFRPPDVRDGLDVGRVALVFTLAFGPGLRGDADVLEGLDSGVIRRALAGREGPFDLARVVVEAEAVVQAADLDGLSVSVAEALAGAFGTLVVVTPERFDELHLVRRGHEAHRAERDAMAAPDLAPDRVRLGEMPRAV